MHFQNGKAELQTKLSIVKDEIRDEYLEERLKQYDRWMAEGKIPTSSKVIPVWESLSALQWVLPTEQVLEIMRNSRSYALANCVYRERYERCNNPLEVCFYINDVADKAVALGKARHVTLKEAEEKLKLANQYGLIHLSIYNPDQYVFAVCSCCECCCHDLQFLKKFNRSDLIAFSEYIAVVHEEACSHCGACVKRCVFGAKQQDGPSVTFNRSRCYGCGLCVTVCPVQAIQMERRNKTRRKNTSDARVCSIDVRDPSLLKEENTKLKAYGKGVEMKTYAAILVEKQGAVGWISLNRPECFNALNIQMAEELCRSSHDFSLDANIRVVVISGHGRAFFAGGDIKEMRSHLGSDVYLRDLTLYLHSFISEIVRMPKPVIAAVNGPAAGAGFSLTLACDLTIASESASFTMAYSRIGLVPDGSSTYFLPRLVGYKRAIEMTLLNKPLTPREAMDMGLVNKIFPEETFIEDVKALAMELSSGPYEAFANTKKLFQTGMLESLETQMEYERRKIAQQSLGFDFAEGITAFIEKRKPNFR